MSWLSLEKERPRGLKVMLSSIKFSSEKKNQKCDPLLIQQNKVYRKKRRRRTLAAKGSLRTLEWNWIGSVITYIHDLSWVINMRTYQSQIRVKVIVMKYRKSSPHGGKRNTEHAFFWNRSQNLQEADNWQKQESSKCALFCCEINRRKNSRKTKIFCLQQLQWESVLVKGCKLTDDPFACYLYFLLLATY